MKTRFTFLATAILAIAACALPAQALRPEMSFGIGYNIGATTPMGIPAEIRSIGGYSPGNNLSVAVFGKEMFAGRWGVGIGLQLSNEGMKSRITTRNYHLTMDIVDGDETGTKTGYYTGSIRNTTRLTYLTIPVFAVWRPARRWEVTAGPYVAVALNRSFKGNVLEGRMRETPLMPAIGITRAEYDYSDDMRRIDCGAMAGATWRVYGGLGIRAALQWGMLSVLDPSKRKVDMNTYNVYLNLGVTYTL